MGTVVRFPVHATSSLKDRTPKTEGSARKRSRVKILENAGNSFDGMRLRNFQLDTAGSVTPANLAAAELPPIASITCSTELSMTGPYSHIVNMSTAHKKAIEPFLLIRNNAPVGTRNEIAQRVIDTREALGLSPAQLCKIIECKPNRWSQYEAFDSKRSITLDIALRLKKEFAVTTDWIYAGDAAGLSMELRLKIKAVQAKRPKPGKSA